VAKDLICVCATFAIADVFKRVIEDFEKNFKGETRTCVNFLSHLALECGGTFTGWTTLDSIGNKNK